MNAPGRLFENTSFFGITVLRLFNQVGLLIKGLEEGTDYDKNVSAKGESVSQRAMLPVDGMVRSINRPVNVANSRQCAPRRYRTRRPYIIEHRDNTPPSVFYQ